MNIIKPKDVELKDVELGEETKANLQDVQEYLKKLVSGIPLKELITNKKLMSEMEIPLKELLTSKKHDLLPETNNLLKKIVAVNTNIDNGLTDSNKKGDSRYKVWAFITVGAAIIGLAGLIPLFKK